MEVLDSVNEFVAWIDLILCRLNGSDAYASYVWNDAWQQAEFNATHFGLSSEPDSLAHLRGWSVSPDSREAELIRNHLRARLSAIRVALTGQGVSSGKHVAKLDEKWRALADRFRRIANNDCSDADVEATAAVCGPVLPRMRDAGLIPANLILEPSAAELQKHAGQPDVIAHLWSTCWTSFVIAASHSRINPGFPIPNPLAIKSEHRGGPNDITVGGTNTKDWRIWAENFAAVCDALADEATGAASDQSGSTETATNGRGDTGDDPPCLLVDLASNTATLNGTPYDVRSSQTLRWVKVLADHPGEWIAGPDLQTYDAELDGVRTDKLRPYLPSEIATLIDSSTGKGSRFNPGATGVTRP
jgi:hypothetical protein